MKTGHKFWTVNNTGSVQREWQETGRKDGISAGHMVTVSDSRKWTVEQVEVIQVNRVTWNGKGQDDETNPIVSIELSNGRTVQSESLRFMENLFDTQEEAEADLAYFLEYGEFIGTFPR